tara:strand:+ start:51 stop:785 length:735 start_codon:yes stop_codon:yes gene_type:complete
MSDKYQERIAVALESIADSLEEMVKRPLPLRTVEKRLEQAVLANDQLSEIAIASVTEQSKPETVEIVQKESILGTTLPKARDSVFDTDLEVGVRVLISGSEGPNDGCVGTIVDRAKNWITVSVETGNDVKKPGETISVRKSWCQVLEGEENVETATEVLVEETLVVEKTTELLIDENDPNHPGNFTFDKGARKGESVHEAYMSGDEGKTFVHYVAFLAGNRPEWTEHCKRYCALVGVTSHPDRS